MSNKFINSFKFGYDQTRDEYILASTSIGVAIVLSPYLVSHIPNLLSSFSRFDDKDTPYILRNYYRLCAKTITHQTFTISVAKQYKNFKKNISAFSSLFKEICDELGYMLKLDVDTCDTCVRCFLYENSNDDLSNYVASAIILR